MTPRPILIAIPVLLALLTSSNAWTGGDRTSAEYVASQVELWHNRDGAAFQEVGMELSKCFAASPQLLLEAFTGSPEDFNEWVNTLQYNTFTDYGALDSVDVALSRAYYGALKSLMLQATERAGKVPEVASMAAVVRKQVQELEVRFVD